MRSPSQMGLAIRRQVHRCHLDILGGQWDMSYLHTHGPQYANHHKFPSLISPTPSPLSLSLSIYIYIYIYITMLNSQHWTTTSPSTSPPTLPSFNDNNYCHVLITEGFKASTLGTVFQVHSPAEDQALHHLEMHCVTLVLA
ncbi:hypothetical protein VNO80_03773 [Phaseolus coccineus]|uniref:Uncharacterized protein n=1 Tax=Phaseolus coccineus TaxID=3886 RepID=A0AAN9RNA7_PHACN